MKTLDFLSEEKISEHSRFVNVSQIWFNENMFDNLSFK